MGNMSKNMKSSRWLVVAFASIALGYIVVRAIERSASFVRSQQITIDDPRPLSAAVLLIERRCHCVVTYEDPVYTRSEVMDVSSQVRRDGRYDPVFVPTSQRLQLDYLGFPEGSNERAGLVQLLRQVVEVHQLSGNHGVFRVVENDYGVHVVPVGRGGTALDETVDIVRSTETAMSAMQEIIRQINAHGRLRVTMALAPVNILRNTNVSLNEGTVSARDAITTVLSTLPSRLSWHLLYDFTLKTYYLNLVSAE